MNEKGNLPDIPKNWIWLQVKDTFNNIPLTDKKIKKRDYQKEGILPIIDQGQSLIGGYTDKLECQVNAKLPVVIFGDHTRCFKYIDFNFVAGADGIRVLQPIGIYNPKLFYYFLQSVDFPHRGYSRHFQYLKKSYIPLPPLNEQKRIVEKIEELETKLDAGAEDLQEIKKKLDVYRNSVFKNAFSNHTKEYKIKEISEKIQYGLTSKSGMNYKGPKYLRITDIQDNKVDWDSVPLAKKTEELDKYYLNEGDVVFARTGATVGKSYLIKNCPKNAIFASYLIRIIPDLTTIIPKLLWYYFQSPMYWAQISKKKLGTGQPNVNGKILSKLIVHIPESIKMQKQLVEEIESQLSVIDKLEEIIDSSLIKQEKLKNSALRNAFEGKLVPQDFSDEPAKMLLKRIKAANENYK